MVPMPAVLSLTQSPSRYFAFGMVKIGVRRHKAASFAGGLDPKRLSAAPLDLGRQFFQRGDGVSVYSHNKIADSEPRLLRRVDFSLAVLISAFPTIITPLAYILTPAVMPHTVRETLGQNVKVQRP
jgi:hypothetical protein